MTISVEWSPVFEAFQWVGDLTPEDREGRFFVRGRAIHPCKTYHPGEWPEVRVYLEEELRKSAETLSGRPLILDHSVVLDPPNMVLEAAWEDGAVEYVAEVSEEIYSLVKSGEIKHVSVEYDWRILEKLDGVAPRGLEMTGLSLLRSLKPGDPTTTVQAWEGVVGKLMRIREQETERERLHREREERARKYGITPKPGGSLTKPSEYGDIPEDGFADPVNWRYPVDPEHVRGALTYFNQPDNRRDYSHEEQVKIMAKIIQAALRNGIEVSYQPEDPVYRGLPEELKSRLRGYGEEAAKPGEAEKLKRELEEAKKLIQTLTEELEGYRRRMSAGEAVVEPNTAERPVGCVKAEEIMAILPRSVPMRWGAGPNELVRRLRRKCLESMSRPTSGPGS